MSSQEEQIKLAYEAGMTAQEIADDLCLDIVAVKQSLISNTGFYLEAKKDNELFGKEDLKSAAETIKRLQYSEVDAVALRAALAIVEEGKGRNDVKALKDASIPFSMFNEMLKRAKEARNKAIDNGDSAINITSTITKAA